MHRRIQILILFLCSLLCWECSREIELISQGQSDYVLVLPKAPTPVEEFAAAELHRYLKRMTGVSLPMVADTDTVLKGIWIGRTSLSRQARIDTATLEQDGFELRTVGDHLIIAGGNGRGALYGVYTLLESYWGCRRYSADCERIPEHTRLTLPPLHDRQVPFFRYREILMPETADSTYAAWHKLHTRYDRARDWGMWVHTFDDLVPPQVYFRKHPEYFALNNGRRVPTTQLCLSNPAVRQIVLQNLKQKMAARPEARYWSVSQNDTYGPCECDSCQAWYRRFGGYSGAIIHFVNQIAANFPDKIISTLAYQYSRSAPTIKPATNVNVVLCTIEMNRSRPIATDPDPESRRFCRDIRDWSRLTDNILVWDYVVQFRNYMDPFPNLRVLQPNVQFFRDHGVRYLFEQGSNRSRSEFHELRTYLLAKLLWDPDIDIEAVMDDFLKGYYGRAAPFLRRYIDMMHFALEKSGKKLVIYGNPYDGVDGYLRPELLLRYSKLFDQAEAAVEGDSLLWQRVRTARLPLEFAILELSRRQLTPVHSLFEIRDGKVSVKPEMRARLERFVDGCTRAGIDRLHEYGLSPEEYRQEMEEYFRNGFVVHKALGRPVQLGTPFSPKYPVGGAKALTDGLRGTNDYHCNWLGFEGEELEATVDLGTSMPIREIETRFLQDVRSWVWLPRKVLYFVSTDGERFEPVGSASSQTGERVMIACSERFVTTVNRSARFVRVRTESFLKCPDWHLGAGGKAWIFIDEIVVR